LLGGGAPDMLSQSSFVIVSGPPFIAFYCETETELFPQDAELAVSSFLRHNSKDERCQRSFPCQAAWPVDIEFAVWVRDCHLVHKPTLIHDCSKISRWGHNIIFQ
jgi:hypothetical protein